MEFRRVLFRSKGVFNEYRYSVTTAKHQSNMRSLLRELGIPVVIRVKSHVSLTRLSMADVRACLLKEFYALKSQLLKCRRESKKRDSLEWQLERIVADIELIDGAPFD